MIFFFIFFFFFLQIWRNRHPQESWIRNFTDHCCPFTRVGSF